jgi:hypothetical protein
MVALFFSCYILTFLGLQGTLFCKPINQSKAQKLCQNPTSEILFGKDAMNFHHRHHN